MAEECIQRRAIRYDKDGDNHYDTISAFIKSMRGSDPDAAVYYLARMLEAGEDPKFIARRIMICASEDVGNADPQALNAVFAARDLVKKTGNLPVPPYLQDAHYEGAQKLGRGIGYQYAHLYRGHYSGQPYMPEKVQGVHLYEPSENGYEEKIRTHLYELTGDSRYQEPEELLDRDPDSGRP